MDPIMVENGYEWTAGNFDMIGTSLIRGLNDHAREGWEPWASHMTQAVMHSGSVTYLVVVIFRRVRLEAIE